MKNERFPWDETGPGPELRLSSGFASAVIEKARATRVRNRRARIGAGLTAGFAALIVTFFWTRSMPANQQVSAHDSRIVAPLASRDFDSISWSNEPDALVTVLMPDAWQAEKFDAYYGAAGWDTYASWDPDSNDSSRTR